MGTEIHPLAPEKDPDRDAPDGLLKRAPLDAAPNAPEFLDLSWVFVGPQGLRSGWSVVIFSALAFIFLAALEMMTASVRPAEMGGITAWSELLEKLLETAAVMGAAWLVARMEQRKLTDFNLAGSRRIIHFLSGLAAGFAALSALVGAMAWGGWLHFGPVALSGAQVFSYAALWGAVFLLTGFFEEGTFRCYLQFTLTRGLNFWWALGIISLLCLDLLLSASDNAVRGVFAITLLGLLPCLLLHVKKAPGSGFWQAAWVTSTLFGFIHTGNNGENRIGIFAAGAIGFVFCVSVRVTGSAWWAIGCHAAWDWAETYFYGTADSGLPAQGHFLTTNPSGAVMWSGGTDGPEGSLLVIPAILLLLGVLVAVYGRGRPAALALPATEQAAG
jgi:hypothetical protein